MSTSALSPADLAAAPRTPTPSGRPDLDKPFDPVAALVFGGTTALALVSVAYSISVFSHIV